MGALLLALMGALVQPAQAAGNSISLPAACSAAHPADFVAGRLTVVSRTQLTIQIPNSCTAPVVVRLQPTTQICRRTCTSTWQELQVGDRVEVALASGANGVVTARWVDANSIAYYGEVTAVHGTAVTIMLTRNYPGSVRVLHIQPSTVVVGVDGRTVTGQIGSLQVGNDVYVTGTADTPMPQDTNVWANRVFQLGKLVNAPQIPATGAGGLETGRSDAPALAAFLLSGILLSKWLGHRRSPQNVNEPDRIASTLRY